MKYSKSVSIVLLFEITVVDSHLEQQSLLVEYFYLYLFHAETRTGNLQALLAHVSLEQGNFLHQ